jgi:predicted MPP superfamily phosphohydrolase
MGTKINILHLSDLHFGIEQSDKISVTALARRENTLAGLLKILSELEPDWKPNIVAISGDIGWKCREGDYQQAETWLDQLVKIVDVGTKEVVIAAGNHDIDRIKTKGMKAPTSAKEADDWLQIENLDNFVRPFETFISFSKKMGISSLFNCRKRISFARAKRYYGLKICCTEFSLV